MARPYISKEVRKKVAATAKHRCGYCLTPQSFTAMPMELEHIIPIVAGGPSIEDNLWVACPLCNGYKVFSQKIGAFSEPDRFWKPVGFFPELLSMYQ